MVFWQLTIDANDPARLARFWAQAVGYQSVPPTEPETTWNAHYRARLGEETAFDNRLFDPAGLRPPADPQYYVVMHDPEDNEFCVS